MKGWLGIAAFVAAYDGWAGLTGNKTLSSQYRAAARAHPILLWTTCVYMTAHLHGLVPATLDPLSAYTVAFRRLGGDRT